MLPPQIAVPTSVGYGAAFGGVSPLLSALTAGAPGVATVNVRPCRLWRPLVRAHCCNPAAPQGTPAPCPDPHLPITVRWYRNPAIHAPVISCHDMTLPSSLTVVPHLCLQIDNGFGAAMLAARMLRTASKIRSKIDASHTVEALAGEPGRHA